MPSQIRAIVKPELLVWARESMGLSLAEAARKAAVPVERLNGWERGDGSPTINQLRTMARIYRRPLAVFFLPEAPRRFDAMRDFRRLPEGWTAEHSPELNLEIRRARVRREVVLELAAELGVRIPQIRFQIGDLRTDPDRFADAARKLLHVGLTEQFRWRDKYEALNNWIGALERVGVLVFQTSDVELREMRGFSIREEALPVIVANAQDAPRGRIFTVLHEFAHILLRTGGLCDLHEHGQPANEDQRIEVLCNRIAGSMLVPESPLRDELQTVSPQSLRRDLDQTVLHLAGRFSVSQEVVLRRLLAIGAVTRAVYQEKHEEYQKAYEQRRPTDGYASPSVMALRDLGRQFVRIVVDAYRQEAITSADLSDFLGVRLKHLPKIEQAVFRGAA